MDRGLVPGTAPRERVGLLRHESHGLPVDSHRPEIVARANGLPAPGTCAVDPRSLFRVFCVFHGSTTSESVECLWRSVFRGGCSGQKPALW